MEGAKVKPKRELGQFGFAVQAVPPASILSTTACWSALGEG